MTRPCYVTESRNNVLFHKNEEDRQANRQGDVVEGQGKRGDMGGCKYIVDRSCHSVLIFEMCTPCCSCSLNSSTICIIRILRNPDRNLGSTPFRIKPVHL